LTWIAVFGYTVDTLVTKEDEMDAAMVGLRSAYLQREKSHRVTKWRILIIAGALAAIVAYAAYIAR